MQMAMRGTCTAESYKPAHTDRQLYTKESLTRLFIDTRQANEDFLFNFDSEITSDEYVEQIQKAAKAITEITGSTDSEAVSKLMLRLMSSETERQHFFRQYGIVSAFAYM